MKLTITTPLVTGSPKPVPFTLADDSVRIVAGTAYTGFPNGATGQIKEGFVNKQRRAAQKTPLFRGAYPFLAPRYNLESSFAFTVQRSFQDAETCIAFIALHPDTVPVTGEIALTNTDSSGSIIRYLPGAVIESVECVKHIGSACDFRYAVTANAPWQTAP